MTSKSGEVEEIKPEANRAAKVIGYAMANPRKFYNPADVEEAHERLGASCGPCSLAAFIGRNVMGTMEFFPEFPGYTNGTTMLKALELAKLSERMVVKSGQWPENGLCWIGFKGSWSVMPFHVKIKYSHWLAVRTIPGDGRWVWDVNARAWQSLESWEAVTLPLLLSRYKKATGGYEVFRGIEVETWHPRMIRCPNCGEEMFASESLCAGCRPPENLGELRDSGEDDV